MIGAPNDSFLLRNVVEQPCGWKIDQTRWGAVAEIFLIGSTTAQQLCRRFGVDPDEIKKRRKGKL